MVALLALLALAAVPALAQWKEYNITFDDSSPMLQWTPMPSMTMNITAPGLGWSFNYSQAPTTYMVSLGSSAHTTTRVGSSVSLRFTGTGAYFTVSGPGVVTLNTNGQQATPQSITTSTTQIGIGGMSYDDHTVTLSLNSGQVAVTGAVVTTIVGGSDTSITNITIPGLGEGNQVTKGIKVTDPAWWEAHPLMCNLDGSHCVTDNSITTATPQSTLQLSPPNNTAVMLVYGGTGPTNGNFIANISPNPIHGPSTTTYSPGGPLLNMYSLLWFVALDPNQIYTTTFTYLGGDGMDMFDFYSVVYLVTSGNTTVPGGLPAGSKNGGSKNNGGGGSGSSSNSNIGAIVGGVVGGIGFLAILAGAFWWWRRRNQRENNKWQSEGVSPMNLVDDTPRRGSLQHTQRESYMPPLRTDFGTGDFHTATGTVTAYPTDTVYSDHSHSGSIDPATRPLINQLNSFGSSFGDASPFPPAASSNAEGSRVAELHAEGTESVVSGASDRKTAAGPAAPASEADVEFGLPSYNEAIVSPVHRSPQAGANVHPEQRMSSAVSTHSAHSAREMDIIGYRLALLERRLEESGGSGARHEATSPVIARPSAVLAHPEPIAESPELAEPRVTRPLPPAPEST
ncbi:uncharacterized protein LOC62_01G000070 [Vanrija pseudolonga]|uniref:Mid2 domain-containing protein n=1 Tax=Vanrija pseudolonga TaxID=143232 RepID=A0AAF0Y4B6_9TREE|nr:hypothetical protein LOC62_01G000070 [Vanrija pseudolonga]